MLLFLLSSLFCEWAFHFNNTCGRLTEAPRLTPVLSPLASSQPLLRSLVFWTWCGLFVRKKNKKVLTFFGVEGGEGEGE